MHASFRKTLGLDQFYLTECWFLNSYTEVSSPSESTEENRHVLYYIGTCTYLQLSNCAVTAIHREA